MEIRVALLIIGDEILYGQTQDINTFFIAQKCVEKGLNLDVVMTIGDKHTNISNAIVQLSEKNDIIITSGGLGPTKDDKTKIAISQMLNSPLVINSIASKWVEKYCKEKGLFFNQLNQKQAELPKQSIPLKNERGTACGIFSKYNGTYIFNLPGIPSELEYLFVERVLPILEKDFDLQPEIHEFIYTKNFPESEMSIKLNELEEKTSESIKWAYLPSKKRVKIRLTAKKEHKEVLLKLKKKIKELLPKENISRTDTWLEDIDFYLKTERKTISCAESFTSGLLASKLTQISGSSSYFRGGIVAYSPEMKVKLLSVSQKTIENKGVVNEEVAIQMAENIKRLTGSDYAISTTGVAGPNTDEFNNPVGTAWVAIALPEYTTKTFFFDIKNKTRQEFIQEVIEMVFIKFCNLLDKNI